MVGEGVVIPDRSLVRSMLFPFDKSWALLLFEWTDVFSLYRRERWAMQSEDREGLVMGKAYPLAPF
jgi:hypothetical protein